MREVHRGIFPAIPLVGGSFHSRALNVLEENPLLFGEGLEIRPKIEKEPKNVINSYTFEESIDLLCIYDGLRKRNDRYGVAVELKTISKGALSLKDRAKAESQLYHGINYLFRKHKEIPHVPYGILVTVSHEGNYEWEKIYLDRLKANFEFNQRVKRQH